MKEKIQKIYFKAKDFVCSDKFKISGLSMIIFFILLVFAFVGYSIAYQNKIYPNIFIGQMDFGGLNKEEAKAKIKSKAEISSEFVINFTYGDKNWKTSYRELEINYDIDKTIDKLYHLGRSKNFWQNIIDRINVLFAKRVLSSVYSCNKNKSEEVINTIISEINSPEKDASIAVKNGQVEILSHQFGIDIDEDNLEQSFKNKIGYMEEGKIEIKTEESKPRIYENQLTQIKNQVERIISQPIILLSEIKNYKLTSDNIAKWLEVIAVPVEKKISQNYFKNVYAKEEIEYQPKVIINPEKINIDVENFSKEIYKEPVDARLTISGGKVTVFIPSKDGYVLNKEETKKMLLKIMENRFKVAGITSEENGPIEKEELNLPIEVKKPLITNETIDNLGIKELIGKGTTNFKKSPPNRINNIKVGSSMFNGVLIKPGEIFSTLKTLGDISLERGFLPELVIKEDSTKPEIGGGLCQVSTTLFRAALNAGLPIIERTNHKYRVSYYEPPVGMDATIYDPAPDLKFENNTPGYILIQTYISGTELTFEFYGTNDGRKVEISNPIIYETMNPGEPIYKEDTSLAPGEVKQVEKAHQGAKASFYYKVTRNGEILFEKTFYSTYVAWRAVYLRGPGEVPLEDNNSTGEIPTPPENPTPEPSPSST